MSGFFRFAVCLAVFIQASLLQGAQGFSQSDIPLKLSSGRTMVARLRLPEKKDTGRSLPVFLVFGGFERADQVLDLLQPEFPVALASFDYPFEGSRELRFPESLKRLPAAKRLFPETVEGIRLLANELKSRPGLDPRKVFVVGASFGSPFALAAAADNPDVSGLVIVHGFGRIAETAENVLLRSWRPHYGWLAEPLAWLLSRSLWAYLDLPGPEDYARRLARRQRVLMITAARDSFIPPESSDSLWNALQESPAHLERLDLPGDHLMPGSDSLIRRMMREIRSWLG
jgi:dienelactone hydrolase